MPDRGASSRIPAPAAEALPRARRQEFHITCGKFCEELTWVVCKCLCLKRFFGFEQQCSNLAKPVGMNGLACVSPNCNSFISGLAFWPEIRYDLHSRSR